MIETIIAGVVLSKAINLAAEIGTWCYNNGAKHERRSQHQIRQNTYSELRYERQRQRDIEYERRREIREQENAAHQAHYELLSEVWNSINELRHGPQAVLKEFQKIQRQNKATLKSTALTPEQRAVINENMSLLETGIQRMKSYTGPYLHYFRNELKYAQAELKNKNYITPDLPATSLPDEFPHAGALLEFSVEELKDFPRVIIDKEYGQRGIFITTPGAITRPTTPLLGFIKRYDRDSDLWILSASAGELAMDLTEGTAHRVPRQLHLGRSFGAGREATWEASNSEILKMTIDTGALSREMQQAPWGTPMEAYVHSSDFFLNNIHAGEYVAIGLPDNSWSLNCQASQEFWVTYRQSILVSEKIIVREKGMQGDPKAGQYVIRIATGHEYPMSLSQTTNSIVIGEAFSVKIGHVTEGNREFCTYLFDGHLADASHPEIGNVTEFENSIRQSYIEQEELIKLAKEDELELAKYQAVLRAEFEVSRRRNSKNIGYTNWKITSKEDQSPMLVEFTSDVNIEPGFAISQANAEKPIGWSQTTENKKTCVVSILGYSREAFKKMAFPKTGNLVAITVEHELQNKIDAIENFLSASASNNKSKEEQESFTKLRKELMGKFSTFTYEPEGSEDLVEKELDSKQTRAVKLITGEAPLVLIQGPPGTGKTHVIAHAINRILSLNPNTRIAITSQANPAVDELVDKIQTSFPQHQIYRDYSTSAQEKYATMDRGVGLDNHLQNLKTSQEALTLDGRSNISSVQSWLKSEISSNEKSIKYHIERSLTVQSQIVACTLSRLHRISDSAPPFDIVIVDEAAKASLPETMIAANCTKRIVLVGDHKQLLPFLDESYYEHSAPGKEDKKALQDLWNDSLFARLWASAPDSRKSCLSIMRRSRQPIAECISTCFYDGELESGRNHTSPSVNNPLSLIWVDSKFTKHVRSGKTSISNPGEAKLVIAVINEVLKLKTTEITIGIIAFHRGQVTQIQKELQKQNLPVTPDVLTVDASQGGQWDVVILSFARTSGGAGFVGNPNRLNVALSRAKEMCFIIGNRVFARNDKTKGSCLTRVCAHMDEQPKKGKWGCNTLRDHTIPAKFNYPPSKPRR